MKINTIFALLLLSCALYAATDSIERWGLYEAEFNGPQKGNPFVDVKLAATFQNGEKKVKVTGFYEGNGVYKIRFMPTILGSWTFTTQSNIKKLDGKQGSFQCVHPQPENHGPVSVFNTFHFAYADGTPYKQIGTTCYAWIHQTKELQEQTLETLSESAFNKIRMCIFPKDYTYNQNEPEFYAFVRDKDGENDYTRFDPDFWAHLEKRIMDLQKLGIEADLILFHPYDRWGYAEMTDEQDDFYLKYALARLSAFRNVWWSLANEFDFMQHKSMENWDRFYKIITENDPYDHLRGIHNGRVWYDHTKPWVTHCSIQSSDFTQMREWQEKYQKPILYDECRYEGNIPEGWGNITAKEMVDRFWKAAAAGCYLGHGETYSHPDDIIWWSKGGVLHGESPERISFFKTIFDDIPQEGLSYIDKVHGGVKDKYYLYYFSTDTPTEWTFNLPPYLKYKVDIIDAWNMTITPQDGHFYEQFTLALPGKPYIAVRVQAVDFNFPYPAVDVHPSSSLFLNSKMVSLTHKDDMPIYYTLDGSAPTRQSTRYEKPIKITKDDTRLKAVCIDADGIKSKLTHITFSKTTALPAVDVKKVQPGISYNLYHGKWDMLPAFSDKEVVKSGVTLQIDLEPQDQPDEFGLVFEGLIKIPKTDVYSFFTNSDDGTKLWMDDELVVSNDGIHGPVQVGGEIGLKKGMHRIRVDFFENVGGEKLEVLWESSTITKEIIPAEVFYHIE